MKRILFVTPDLNVGGVQRALIALLNTAPFDKFDITLLLFCEGGALREQVPSQVHIKVDTRVGRTEKLRAVISKGLRKSRLNGLFDLAKKIYHRTGEAMVRTDHEERYDAAVAYSDGLATWYVAKSVQAERKIAFVHTDFLKAGYSARQEREIYSCFEQIVFAAQAARQSFLAVLPEWEEKTAILPNVVDPQQVVELAKQPIPNPRQGIVKLATVGRLSHEKGAEKIPPLLYRLKASGQKVCWYVVGDGPERNNILRQAQKLGVEEELLLVGQLENPYPYMRECDVYVQPSEYEGYCIALAEAKILFRPIVACDFAGAREQIEDGVTGFVTGLGAEDLFPAILTLASQPQKRIEFEQALAQRNDAERTILQARCWWGNLDGQKLRKASNI